jgi:hypothetical protein
MADTVTVPFATQSYLSRSKPISAQRLVNLFPEAEPGDAKTPVALFGTPGLTAFGNVGPGPIRGEKVMNDTLYVVSGSALYSVDSAGSSTNIGTVDGLGIVYMIENGTQLCVVTSTGSGYVYDRSDGSYGPIDDEQWPGASTADYVDGYGVFTQKDSQEWFLSNLLDFTAYEGTDFATAESATDSLVRVFVNERVVHLFGSQSIELWGNTGAASFPFERVGSGLIENGLAAAAAVTRLTGDASKPGGIAFLGSDKVVYLLVGAQAMRISTHGVEYQIGTYGSLSDAEFWSYDQEGHTFLVAHFPSVAKTWCYDLSTSVWHERGQWNPAVGDFSRWIARSYAFAYGKHIVGHHSTGDLYEMSLDTYDEDGDQIVRQAVSAPVSKDNIRMVYDRLEMDMEVGVGLASGQGSDPQCFLDWSDDGGFTWSNQIQASMGAKGKYNARVIFRRMGQGRKRIFRLWFSDPVKTTLLQAQATARRGLS